MECIRLSRPRVFQVTLVSRKLIITHGEVLDNQKASEGENNCSLKYVQNVHRFPGRLPQLQH